MHSKASFMNKGYRKSKYLLILLSLSLFVSELVQAVELFSEPAFTPRSEETELFQRYNQFKKAHGTIHTEVRRFSPQDLHFLSSEQMQNDYPNFTFTTPDGRELKANYLRTLEQPGGIRSWIGRIEGDQYSLAVITIQQNHMAADITAFGNNYSLKPLAMGTVGIRQVQPSALDTETEDVVTSSPFNVEIPFIKTHDLSVEDDGSVIDIYVHYTDDAAAASASIETEIATDIAYTNTALDQSCTQTSLRIVGMSMLTFDETLDGDNYLTMLTNPKDGNYDGIFDTLRSSGADMLQLWVENSLGSVGNNAAVGSVLGIATAAVPHPAWSSGFSVKVRSAPAGVTAHEIGHNFSVWHDRYQCPSTMLQGNYAVEGGFGFINLNESVRDIMSYATECAAHQLSCTALPYYSNPRLMIQGSPFGIPNQADAAYRIYKNRIYLAQARPAKTTPTQPSFAACAENTLNQVKMDKCFIATAAYGSFLDSKVVFFRQFRDSVLNQSTFGKFLVKIYYQYSPPLADWITRHPWTKPPVRGLLYGVYLILKSPWLILGCFLMAAFFLWAPLRRREHKDQNFNARTTFLSLLVLCVFLMASKGWASHNPTFLSTPDVANPATLKNDSLFSTRLSATDGSYKSNVYQKYSFSQGMAPALGLLYASNNLALGLYADSSATEKYTAAKGNETDHWQLSKQKIRANVALAMGNSLVVGMGFLQNSSSLVREASGTSWGVHETTRVETLQSATLGYRMMLFEPFTMGGHLEAGQSLASDVAKASFVNAEFGIGYRSQDFLQKWDVSYLYSPESLAHETAPIANDYHGLKKGVELDIEFKIPFGFMIDHLFLGLQQQTLTQSSYKNEGHTAKISCQKIKLAFNTSQKLQWVLTQDQNVRKESVMILTENNSALNLNWIF